MEILHRAILFLFTLSAVHLLREGARFASSFRNGTKYASDWRRTLATMAAASFIITTVSYGF